MRYNLDKFKYHILYSGVKYEGGIFMPFQIIPVDTGRNETKLLDGISFKSIVGDWHHREMSDGGEYEVIINDKEKHFVGQLAEDESFAPTSMNTASKIHNQTRVLFITAVGLSIVENESDLLIVTGVPIIDFNTTTKKALEDLLYGDYDIQINGERKKFSINNLKLVPEAVASFQYALYKDESLAIGKKRILDLGSLTVNYATIKETKFITRDSGTVQFGSIKLKDNHIDDKQYVQKIISELSEKFTDYEDSDRILLTGGGALKFGDLFKQFYKNVEIITNPVFSNTNGYHRMGLKAWANQLANSQAE